MVFFFHIVVLLKCNLSGDFLSCLTVLPPKCPFHRTINHLGETPHWYLFRGLCFLEVAVVVSAWEEGFWLDGVRGKEQPLWSVAEQRSQLCDIVT